MTLYSNKHQVRVGWPTGDKITTPGMGLLAAAADDRYAHTRYAYALPKKSFIGYRASIDQVCQGLRLASRIAGGSEGL